MNVQEDAAKAKYAFRNFYDYVAHKTQCIHNQAHLLNSKKSRVGVDVVAGKIPLGLLLIKIRHLHVTIQKHITCQAYCYRQPAIHYWG